MCLRLAGGFEFISLGLSTRKRGTGKGGAAVMCEVIRGTLLKSDAQADVVINGETRTLRSCSPEDGGLSDSPCLGAAGWLCESVLGRRRVF